jgi:hypothetical protein
MMSKHGEYQSNIHHLTEARAGTAVCKAGSLSRWVDKSKTVLFIAALSGFGAGGFAPLAAALARSFAAAAASSFTLSAFVFI